MSDLLEPLQALVPYIGLTKDADNGQVFVVVSDAALSADELHMTPERARTLAYSILGLLDTEKL